METNQPETTAMNAMRAEAIREFLTGDKKHAWELNQRATLAERIEKACAITKPRTKARNAALAGIKWVLRDQFGEYAALGEGLAGPASIGMVSDKTQAITFDGRDNEDAKIKFYNAATGLTFHVEMA